MDGSTFEESYEFAALAVEMSLSRGGDQAVIKDRFNFTFYGGRNKEADYRSKVRSRVTANSIMELIGQSHHVFIMGHKNADLDAVGAAMGIACLCRKKGKKANIVIDLENNSSKKLLEEIRGELGEKAIVDLDREIASHATCSCGCAAVCSAGLPVTLRIIFLWLLITFSRSATSASALIASSPSPRIPIVMRSSVPFALSIPSRKN